MMRPFKCWCDYIAGNLKTQNQKSFVLSLCDLFEGKTVVVYITRGTAWSLVMFNQTRQRMLATEELFIDLTMNIKINREGKVVGI